MNVQIRFFGIAREIVGGNTCELDLTTPYSVAALKETLMTLYPAFGDLKSIMIAVNSEYATDDVQIAISDEVVLIPPVSGG